MHLIDVNCDTAAGRLEAPASPMRIDKPRLQFCQQGLPRNFWDASFEIDATRT